ncbi:TolC family outer membrane protein [Sphingomonas faeni]|uniref:TolC family outer membrane protein n=1 Tax=Sphingomonas faeni TaxID=185950 RepID=UPI003356D1A6
MRSRQRVRAAPLGVHFLQSRWSSPCLRAAGRNALLLVGFAQTLIAPSAIAQTVGPFAAPAETLAEAIALAYQTNPTLQSQRAQLRAIDETYVQSRSQFGPTIQLDANAQYADDRLTRGEVRGVPVPSSRDRTDSVGAQLVVNQPLYTGGRLTLETRAARYRVRAGREALRATEGDIVFRVIQAFVDLRRDLGALEIRRTNLAAVRSTLDEVRARTQAGELTQTDLAQANAQVAAEEANVATAEDQSRASRIAYASVVGRNPGTLVPEPPLPNLPASAQESWGIAADNSPELQQALYNEQQSRARLQEARVSAGPTLSLRGSGSYSTDLDPLNRANRNRSFAGQLVLSQPLFTSGLTRSLVRQAQETNTSDRSQIEVARRAMLQSVTDSWNQMVTLRGNVLRQHRQVEAASTAFRGMTIEYRAGERSTLDVLIAEETLRDAELAELSAQHDAYLSAALVLRYIGRLDAGDIVEALPRYDPADHFREVANRGALPWEPLVRLFDGVMLPAAGQRAIPAPPAANEARIAAAEPEAPQRTVDEVPVTPVPGTVSPMSPPLRRAGPPSR